MYSGVLFDRHSNAIGFLLYDLCVYRQDTVSLEGTAKTKIALEFWECCTLPHVTSTAVTH